MPAALSFPPPRRSAGPVRAPIWIPFVLMFAGIGVIGVWLYQNVASNFLVQAEQRQAAEEVADLLYRPPGDRPPVRLLDPRPGQVFAVLSIPRLGVTVPVVEGVRPEHLNRGVGHHPVTVEPGRPGNALLVGNRTTHGRPFWDLQRLAWNDEILVQTAQGVTQYRVTRTPMVFAPDDMQVAPAPADPSARMLTLLTSHPRFSNRERLMVVAEAPV